jgi:hypothetical protein
VLGVCEQTFKPQVRVKKQMCAQPISTRLY